MGRTQIAVVDWDGTLQSHAWPAWGEWLPGATEAMRELQKNGVHVIVSSARISPFEHSQWPILQPRSEGDVAAEIHEMRSRLDAAGLHTAQIWNERGKPSGDIYIDDKALWFPGRTNSWKKLTPVILSRLGVKHDLD